MLSVYISYFFDPNWLDKKAVAVVLFCVDCFDGTRRGIRVAAGLELQAPLALAHEGGQGDAGDHQEADQGRQQGEDHVRGPGRGDSLHWVRD